MGTSPSAITPKGEPLDGLLYEEVICLYEREPDLLQLPNVFFESVGRLIESEVVTYSEFHHRTGEFRALISVDDDPHTRANAIDAYARHMFSHPFWQNQPAFFGERALRESDFFSEEEFLALPIAIEAFLPSRARHMMTIVMQHEAYVVCLSGHRILGRPAFSDQERDRFQAFRPHALRSYRQAQERTLAKLTPGERLGLAFPDLTPRQLEVASWLAEGKSNEDIATILDVGIDTVKAHVKALYSKIGSDSRLGAAIIAHTTPPFAQLPPLWKLHRGSWGERKDERDTR